MRCGMLEIGMKPWKSSKDLGGQSRTLRANPTGKCIDLPQAQKLLSSPSWSTSGKPNPRVKWRQAFHIFFTTVPAFSKDLQNRASMRWTTIWTKTLACTYIDIYIYILYIFFVGFNRGQSNKFWQSVARLLEPVPGLCLKSISIPARQALALSSSSRCRLARRRLKLHCEEALRLRCRFANLAGCLRGGLRHLPISRERHHAYGYGWIGNRYCASANIGKQFDTKSFPFWLSWQPAILGSTRLRLLSVCLNLRLRSGPSCRTGTSRASLV